MTEFLCSCGKRMLRQTTWFCSACDGMENPRLELIEARKRIAELEAIIAASRDPSSGDEVYHGLCDECGRPIAGEYRGVCDECLDDGAAG